MDEQPAENPYQSPVELEQESDHGFPLGRFGLAIVVFMFFGWGAWVWNPLFGIFAAIVLPLAIVRIYFELSQCRVPLSQFRFLLILARSILALVLLLAITLTIGGTILIGIRVHLGPLGELPHYGEFSVWAFSGVVTCSVFCIGFWMLMPRPLTSIVNVVRSWISGLVESIIRSLFR